VKTSQITKQYELHDLPNQELDRYESKLMKSESVMSVIEIIFDMFLDLMSAVGKKPPAGTIDKTFSSKARHKDLLSEPSDLKHSDQKKEIKDENYLMLEKVLQKYEADIRNHIRTEQQLKLYSDSIQETLEDNERIYLKELHSKDTQIKVAHSHYKGPKRLPRGMQEEDKPI
jgi:hypothetical protein